MKNMLCNHNCSLLEAMEVINKNGKKTVFVVDDSKKLKGVLTDGDIRALILHGRSLNTKLSNILKRKFVFFRKGADYSRLLAKLPPFIKIVPIVDDDNRPVDYIQADKDIHIPVASPNLNGNEFTYLVNAFLSTWISSSGEYINRFERQFADFCGCKYGLAVSNGTAALHLALTALGIRGRDEVIVPDLTFAASINTVLHAGAIPVIVDIEKDGWTIDPHEIERAITPNTKAIMPVHIYGQPCNMDEIMRIARKRGLFVVEDCAEAHGAKFKGKKVGSFGDVGCFSFFANKIITTGEGGMCVTNSKKLYEKMLVLRDHGMSRKKKYWHEEIGFNYRMTNIQAALGCAQLERVNHFLRARKNLEKKYQKIFGRLDCVEFQKDIPNRSRVTWLISVLVKNNKRDAILKNFAKHGIEARPLFYSLGTMPIYKKYLFSNSMSKKISVSGLTLPTQLDMTDEEIMKIERVLSLSVK